MKKIITSKKTFLGIIANVIEHYENALYSLLAPFLSPLFFPNQKMLDGLILTYSFLALGIIFRPLGAAFFGYISDNHGRERALFIALIGTAISSLFITLLPSYATIGLLAPLGIALFKASQGFFSAGQIPAGAILVLEESTEKSLLSSIYDASSLAGILLASIAIFLLCHYNLVNSFWRILFLLGSLGVPLGLFLRKEEKQTPIPTKNREKISDIFLALKNNFFAFFSITIISGFSYSLFYFSLVFFNGFLPLVSDISAAAALKMNTLLLLLDFCTLPLFGLAASFISKEKMMLFSSFMVALLSIPLFYLLNHGSNVTTMWIRIIFVLLGVIFSAPLHHVAFEIAPRNHKAKIIALGYAFGSQMIGLPSCVIGFYLFKKTGESFSPALYLTFYAIFSFILIYKNLDQKRCTTT
jgi:MFS transporter, MHS family, proline/betaine transporter